MKNTIIKPGCIIIFSIILISFISTIVTAESNKYITYVRDDFGFYKVRNLNLGKASFTYDDRTLNINNGDTMSWSNDADTKKLTIISDQNLWSDEKGYLRVGQKMDYTFTNSGTYTFYIKEASEKKQTIIVNTGNNNPTAVTITPIFTPEPTAVAITSISTSEPTTVAVIPYKYTTPIPTSTPKRTYPSTSKPTEVVITPIYTRPIPISTPLPTSSIQFPIEITPTSIISIIFGILLVYYIFKRQK